MLTALACGRGRTAPTTLFNSNRVLPVTRRQLHNTPTLRRPVPEHQRTRYKNAVPITWGSAGLMLLVGGAVVYAYQFIKDKKDRDFQNRMIQAVGKPLIGGPYTLVDHHGKPVTDASYTGQYVLIYFGFTHCPDICPTELEKMTRIMNKLDKKGLGQLVQPIFISVDPFRDTIARIREYLKEYHPRFIGLTGTPDQVHNVCKQFRVYYSKAFDGSERDEEEDYLIDHSIIMYLVDHHGNFVEYFGQSTEEDIIVKKIEARLRKLIDEGRGGKDRPLWKKIWDFLRLPPLETL